MPRTRVFRSGNSQAVRIPAELAFSEDVVELTITRHGDVITLKPAGKSLKDAVARLRAMPRPPDIESYEPVPIPERELDWPS